MAINFAAFVIQAPLQLIYINHVRGHPERTSQVRGEGGSAQRGQSKATFIVTMTS